MTHIALVGLIDMLLYRLSSVSFFCCSGGGGGGKQQLALLALSAALVKGRESSERDNSGERALLGATETAV